MCVQIIKHQMKKHKSGHNVGTEADILKMSHFWCNTESVTPIDCTEKMELTCSGCERLTVVWMLNVIALHKR